MRKELEFSIDLQKLAMEHYSEENSIGTIPKTVKLSHFKVHCIVKK